MWWARQLWTKMRASVGELHPKLGTSPLVGLKKEGGIQLGDPMNRDTLRLLHPQRVVR